MPILIKGSGSAREIVEEIDIVNGSVPITIDSSGMLTIPIPNVKRVVGFGLHIESEQPKMYYVQFGSYTEIFNMNLFSAVMYCPTEGIGTTGSVEYSITPSAIVINCSGGRLGSFMSGSDITDARGHIAFVQL